MSTLYKDFQPTGFDSKGAFLEDRQNWHVAPVIQTRDSQPLERANFEAVLEILGGESDTVEVHRFGHWGPGWFEIILVSPSRLSEVESIESRLEDYPILDEEKLSELEVEDEEETWEFIASYDFQLAIARKFDVDLDIDFVELRELYDKAAERAGRYVEHTSEGARFPIDEVVSAVNFDDIRDYI